MNNIPTFAHYELYLYCQNHGLYKLWPFDSHIECLVAYHILRYKASQILLSSCFFIPILGVWTMVVLNTILATY
jgi:hypothetical protein